MPFKNEKDAAGARISLLNDEAFGEVGGSLYDNLTFRPRHSSMQSSNVSSPVDVVSTRHNSWSTRNESSSPLSPASNSFYAPQHSQSAPHQQFSYPLRRNSPSTYQYPPPPPPSTAPCNYGQHPTYPSPTDPSPILPQYPYTQNHFPVSNCPINTHHAGRDRREAPKGEGKRYACRYADEHNCSRTFTTSGHASRHAKIHTAEKMVCCKFAGCDRKFTRSDNMKQHMETHKRRRGAVRGVRKANHTRSSSTQSRESSYSSTAMDMLADIAVGHQHEETGR